MVQRQDGQSSVPVLLAPAAPLARYNLSFGLLRLNVNMTPNSTSLLPL